MFLYWSIVFYSAHNEEFQTTTFPQEQKSVFKLSRNNKVTFILVFIVVWCFTPSSIVTSTFNAGNSLEICDRKLVFHGVVLIIIAINKLLNLPVSSAGQRSPSDGPSQLSCPDISLSAITVFSGASGLMENHSSEKVTINKPADISIIIGYSIMVVSVGIWVC